MTGYQRLAVATSVATFILIIIGAVVRTSGSGLGCPDWPKCHGHYIPPIEKEVLIEYSHRLAASIVGWLVVALTIVTWLKRRDDTRLVTLVTIAFVLLIFQIVLGGVTVLNDLPPEVVTAHLATALALFATLVTITTLALVEPRAASPEAASAAARFQPWAIGGALAVYALMLTGSYVVGSGASLVSLDWPLVNNTLFPTSAIDLTQRLLHIQLLHRATVLVVGIVIGVVAWKAVRNQPDERISNLAWLVVGLYVIQIFIGAGNIWSRLNVFIAAAHLALAAAIWAALVIIVVVNRMAFARSEAAQTRLSRATESQG